ncbi:MAG: class I SAM-dependent methyltransferase [Sumerlaeia bacterium]
MAVSRAIREDALAIARELLAQRRAEAAAAPAQAFAALHAGTFHTDLFHNEFPRLLDALPDGYRALEWGSGRGWVAAHVASDPRAGQVLASEVLWPPGQGPFTPDNAHTLHRMAAAHPPLAERVVDFEFDGKDLTGWRVRSGAPLRFVRLSAHEIPLPDASVDFLWSVNCIEHIPDLRAAFREAARVLRPGGLMFHTTEPLYHSAFGHHLRDIFPVPWGHLLLGEDELATAAEREAGAGSAHPIEWRPGEPLRAEHLLAEVFPTLNRARPADLRAALRPGPWAVRAWGDFLPPEHRAWARRLGLSRALPGIAREALLLEGVRFVLERLPDRARRGWRGPLVLDARVRGWVRRFLLAKQ